MLSLETKWNRMIKYFIGQSVITIQHSTSVQVAFQYLRFTPMQDMGPTGPQIGAQME